MAGITVKSLKESCKKLGIKVQDGLKKKDLQLLVDEYLKGKELGYICPFCDSDIPDVEECPYCGGIFDEEVDDENEVESEENTTDEEVESEVDQDAVEVEDEDSSEPDSDEDEDNASEDEENVSEDKDSDSEDTDKESGKRGRPKGKSKESVKKEENFEELIGKIDEFVNEGFEKRERKTGITYVRDRKRLFKVVSAAKSISIELNNVIEAEVDGLVKFTEEEAKIKHLGSVRAVYTLGDEETALALIKEVI